MAVFAVHLSGDTPAEQARTLEKVYPGDEHYRVSDRFYLVRTDSITRTVAAEVGLVGTGESGAVFKLNASYYGYDSRAMWEWLDEAASR